MIEITLYKQGDKLIGIESKGHSGSARKGNDIICAAVSVLMQALHLGLRQVARLETLIYYADEKLPLMRLVWHEKEYARAYTLSETVAESLKVIAQDNPKYVKVHSTEEIIYDIPF